MQALNDISFRRLCRFTSVRKMFMVDSRSFVPFNRRLLHHVFVYLFPIVLHNMLIGSFVAIFFLSFLWFLFNIVFNFLHISNWGEKKKFFCQITIIQIIYLFKWRLNTHLVTHQCTQHCNTTLKLWFALIFRNDLVFRSQCFTFSATTVFICLSFLVVFFFFARSAGAMVGTSVLNDCCDLMLLFWH